MMTEAAKNDLLLEFMPEVEEIVREMADGTISEEDLLQEGYIGLLAGIEAMNAEDDEFGDGRGLSLGETVREAVREAVESAMKRHAEAYAADDRLVAQVELLNKSIDRLTEELGTKPNIDEIANDMQISQEKVLAILKLTGESVDDEKLLGGTTEDV